MGDQPFLLGIAVEPSDGAQPAGDSRPCPTPRLEVAGEALDLEPADLEQVEAVLVAPGHELAEIELVRVAGQTGVAGREPGQRQSPWVGEGLVERDKRRRW